MDQFPLGVEFDPTHEEVIRYLQWKLNGTQIFQGIICDFDVYSQHPKDLPGGFKFFFTPRHRASGYNVRRSVAICGKQDAYWHTNDKINIFKEPDEPEEKPVLVGQMTAFSFKVRNAGTDWVMHEYLLPEVPGRFQETAICMVRNKRQDRINANKRKGKPLLEVPAISGYAGGSEVGNLASSCVEDVSDFDSRACASKRRKLNDELMIQKVTPRQVCEEFGFMPEENQLCLNNTSNICSFTSGYDQEASTSQLSNLCNQVTMPPPSKEVHKKSSLMRPFCEEFNQDLQSGDKSSVLQEEEDELQQETAQEGFYLRLLEGGDFGKDNPIALDDTDRGLWYAGNDAQNPINDEVNADDDMQADGGEMIQVDRVGVIAEEDEQQIVHHSSAVESLSPQPLAASSNDGSQLSNDHQFSINDLPVFFPDLQLSIDDQFSIDDLPFFDPGLQVSTDDWDTIQHGIPDLVNLVEEDYSIW